MGKKQQNDATISVAEATRRLIKNKPSIIDCLKHEIINYSALAQMLLPDVLEITKKKSIKIDSIKMSLMRYTDELTKDYETLEQKISNVISNSVLELKNNLVVLTVRQKHVISKINLISKLISKFRFFQLVQGTNAFTIIADQNKKMDLIAVFSPESITGIIENQSAVILISPDEITEVPGVISYLTTIFHSKGINITQIMSCYTDTIFIVDRKDEMDAYKTIEERIFFLKTLKK